MARLLVLDSWALLAYFQGEPSGETVEAHLIRAASGREALLLSVVNWTEVVYCVERKGGRAAAEQVIRDLDALPIAVVGVDENRRIAREAASMKAGFRLSLANAFAAALTRERKGALVTGDPEFQPLEGLIRIEWLVKRPA